MLIQVAVPKVLAALKLARQMTTAVMKPAVVVPTAFSRPSAHGKDAVRHRVVNERRVLKHPKAQHWVWKHFMVYTKEALVNIDVCIIYVSGTYARWFPISVLFPCVLGSSDCFLRYSATPELLEPVLQ